MKPISNISQDPTDLQTSTPPKIRRLIPFFSRRHRSAPAGAAVPRHTSLLRRCTAEDHSTLNALFIIHFISLINHLKWGSSIDDHQLVEPLNSNPLFQCFTGYSKSHWQFVPDLK